MLRINEYKEIKMKSTEMYFKKVLFVLDTSVDAYDNKPVIMIPANTYSENDSEEFKKGVHSKVS